MFHANAFVLDLQQTSARGGDKFFSTNWLMPMAQRKLGPGQITLRTMFSLEPATIGGRRFIRCCSSKAKQPSACP